MPLWASATVPVAVAPRVGWAFSQRLPPSSSSACAHGDVADQRVERGLVEDLADQAHVLVDEDLLVVTDGDAGRLLTAVLEGVEPEVRDVPIFAGRPDAEDAAGVLQGPVVWIGLVQ